MQSRQSDLISGGKLPLDWSRATAHSSSPQVAVGSQTKGGVAEESMVYAIRADEYLLLGMLAVCWCSVWSAR